MKKINSNLCINVEIDDYTILKTVSFLTMCVYTLDIEVSYLLQTVMSCFYSSTANPMFKGF